MRNESLTTEDTEGTEMVERAAAGEWVDGAPRVAVIGTKALFIIDSGIVRVATLGFLKSRSSSKAYWHDIFKNVLRNPVKHAIINLPDIDEGEGEKF